MNGLGDTERDRIQGVGNAFAKSSIATAAAGRRLTPRRSQDRVDRVRTAASATRWRTNKLRIQEPWQRRPGTVGYPSASPKNTVSSQCWVGSNKAMAQGNRGRAPSGGIEPGNALLGNGCTQPRFMPGCRGCAAFSGRMALTQRTKHRPTKACVDGSPKGARTTPAGASRRIPFVVACPCLYCSIAATIHSHGSFDSTTLTVFPLACLVHG